MNTKHADPVAFEQAAERFLEPVTSLPGWVSIIISAASIGFAFGFGLAVRVLADPSIAVAVAVSVLVTGAVFVMRLRTGKQLGAVDWDTAEPYWIGIADQIPEANREVIAAVTVETLRNYRAIEATHPYVMPCPTSVADGTCTHGICLNAAVAPVGRRRVALIGRRVLNLPPGPFEAVLWHEMRHATGIMRYYSTALFALRFGGWFAVGLLPYGVPAAVVLWLVLGAMGWANELIADAAAVRVVGRDASLHLWQVSARHAASMPMGWRLAGWLFPTHPPLKLRVAAVHVISWLH